MPETAPRRRVFIETSTIKLSTNSRTVLRPRQATFNLQGREIAFTVHDIVEVNPNDRIRDRAFRAEVDLLPKIADLAKMGQIELLSSMEVWDELLGVILFGRRRTTLNEAPVTMVRLPLRYSRPVGKDGQIAFLMTVRHPRFLELRRVCGANQGGRVNQNQLVDAFHLWCAEEAGATDFLTCDLKLIRLVRNNRRFHAKLAIVSPSELLASLGPVADADAGSTA